MTFRNGELAQAAKARLYGIQDRIGRLSDGAETLLGVSDPDALESRLQ